jgi:hypothetical protein
MIHIDVPNLDDATLNPDELAEFGRNCGMISAYAEHRAMAMRHRLNGEIENARTYERRCQSIYDLLPPGWRW